MNPIQGPDPNFALIITDLYLRQVAQKDLCSHEQRWKIPNCVLPEGFCTSQATAIEMNRMQTE